MAQASFKQLDTNKDGQLSLAGIHGARRRTSQPATPQQALAGLDTNQDGKVSADEFRAPQVAKFDKADANHDGMVTPDEAARRAGQK